MFRALPLVLLMSAVSVAQNAAPRRPGFVVAPPKVSCWLSWKSDNADGTTKENRDSAAQAVELNKPVTFDLQGFTAKATLKTGGAVNVRGGGINVPNVRRMPAPRWHELELEVTQGDAAAGRTDVVQRNVRQALRLTVKNETAFLLCDPR